MCTVYVRVSHDDNLVVAEFRQIEFVATNASAERHDEVADFLRRQHAVKTSALDVQDFTFERQNSLRATVTTCLRGTTCGVTLDEEDFGLGRVFFRTILEFASEEVDVHRGFAAGQFTGFAGCLAGQSGLDDFADDLFGFVRVFLEPFGQFFANEVLNRGTDLGRNELVLGLGRELRIGHFDRENAGQTFAGVVTREGNLFLFRDTAFLRVFGQGAGQRGAEARQVGAAIALRDVVGKGQNVFMVAVVPPHRDLNADAVTFTVHKDRLWEHRVLGAVEVFHELFHAAVVEQFRLDRFGRTLIFDENADARVQEGQFAQTLFQNIVAVFEVQEGAVGRIRAGGSHKAHLRAFFARSVTDHAERFDRHAFFKADVVFFVVAPDAQFEPVGQRVHNGNTHAVQTARDLVGVLVELTTRVQLGHDNLSGGDAFFGVHVYGDTATVVGHRNRAIRVNFHRNMVGVAS